MRKRLFKISQNIATFQRNLQKKSYKKLQDSIKYCKTAHFKKNGSSFEIRSYTPEVLHNGNPEWVYFSSINLKLIFYEVF
jgi:hypothetical protein